MSATASCMRPLSPPNLGSSTIRRTCSAVGFAGTSLQLSTPGTLLAEYWKAAIQPSAPTMPVHNTMPGEKLRAVMPRMTK